ncbi:MAG: hypothetical protein DRI34_12270 [Deltaproteobacteria bacterium]|nr:MAG: hypothetical protein DRI34_12270 [Deltaproteobacteria bacterium]
MHELVQVARLESSSRGFRHTGIYHLLWAIWKSQPDLFSAWLQLYRVEIPPFVKMMETILRPRRAGGGVPRDRIDAELLERALAAADKLAGERGESTEVDHLFDVFPSLPEDPIVSLCQRFSLDYRPRTQPAGE